jgi:hypothetical protein
MVVSCGQPGIGQNTDVSLEPAKSKDGTTPHGARRIDLLHSDGTHLLVSFEDGPESLRVAGYSACFDFPEYEYGEKY